MNELSQANRHFAESIVATLRDAGYQAVFAGGCVRDLLLGLVPKDFDVATDARPEYIRNLFGKHRTLAVGESFGVIVVTPGRRDRERGIPSVEVATFRTDGDYSDGRRPDRVAFATPEADAQRRDFTINGMFLDPLDERIMDFVGGFEDLNNGIIRAIGNPLERMREDRLRLLRAIRFTANLNFELDRETASAVRTMASQLTSVSAERICEELRKMLVHRTRRRAMELCASHGLLEIVFPELAYLFDVESPDFASHEDAWLLTLDRLHRLDVASFELSLAALLAVLIEPVRDERFPAKKLLAILNRLRMSNHAVERVLWLLDHYGMIDVLHKSSLATRKRISIHAGFDEFLTLEEARLEASGDDIEPVLEFKRYVRETSLEIRNPPPLVTGGDLIRLGRKPGPEFSRILTAVRDAQLNEVISTYDEAVDYLSQLQIG